MGDFNNDRRPDLATANAYSSNVSVLFNNGSGGFGTATNYTVGSSPSSVAVGDFNNDGKADLVTANGSDNVSVLFNNGSGGFGSATNYTVGSSPLSVAVGDFNNDGWPDLATANSMSDNLSLLLNNGSGAFSAATDYTVSRYPISVLASDFNNDGKPDLAFVSSEAYVIGTITRPINNVSVLWNNSLSLTTQPASSSIVCLGNSVSTSVRVSVLSEVSYQWYKDNFNTPLANQTGATLNLSTIQSADLGSYSVVITGACNSVTSTAFSLTSNGGTPPNAQLVGSGDLSCTTPTLTLTATGGTNYQFNGPGVVSQTNGQERVVVGNYVLLRTPVPNSGTALVNRPGTYSVLVTGPDGCTNTASIVVTGTECR